MRRAVQFALCTALAALATGCANKHEDLIQFLRDHEHMATASEYRLGIPDRIEISAPRVLEIDQVQQTIGPDGKISLRLLGAVRVIGLTPREVAAKLEALLAPYYEDPKVQVKVMAYASKKVYVFGEVRREGPLPYTGKDSVIDALSAAGPTFIAWKSQIQLIRPSPDPEKTTQITVDLDKMIQSGDIRLNMLLEPGDIVYVPPTPLGWIGLRVNEVLFPFYPAVEAYELPAGVFNTTDEYQNDDGDD